MSGQPEEQESKMLEKNGELRLPRFSISDAAKILGAIAFVLLAWARVESAVGTVSARLDKIEVSQTVFVRSDLAEARNEVLAAKLDEMKSRLERIEMKLDK